MASTRLRDPDFLCGASPTLSFKDVLHGASSSSVSFPNLRISSHRGLPALLISEEEISSLAAPFEFALVGKFPGKRPSIDGIRKFFFNLKLIGDVSVTVLNPRNVLIKLFNDFDYCRIFSHHSYFVNNCYMKVVKWSSNLDVEVDSLIVPIWISFPYLRPHLFSPRILSGLGSLFGRTLKSDTAMASGSHPSVARILVELDVTKNFFDKIWVGSPNSGYVQSVIFDDIPFFCTHYSSLGHLKEECRILHPHLNNVSNSIPTPSAPSALPAVTLVDAGPVAGPVLPVAEVLDVVNAQVVDDVAINSDHAMNANLDVGCVVCPLALVSEGLFVENVADVGNFCDGSSHFSPKEPSPVPLRGMMSAPVGVQDPIDPPNALCEDHGAWGVDVSIANKPVCPILTPVVNAVDVLAPPLDTSPTGFDINCNDNLVESGVVSTGGDFQQNTMITWPLSEGDDP
ncbi:hypothetical protein M5K25_025335 [Dendrobium thyrsiflorum]|uniref:DUF4283 domain-containing protein n=1 Tax=Dendrobium thyrsiflorum TaxID=117978 RepID=A0ABD0U415_DENTH